MKFSQPLIKAVMVKRYKRFLANVVLEDGTPVCVHCPNSGSMKTCWAPGWPALLSESDKPGRKLRYTLEMTWNGSCWIGINTYIPNRIVYEAILAERLAPLCGLLDVKREVRFGMDSRIDLAAHDPARNVACYIEVKNVTLIDDQGVYRFPDAVTSRGRKHVEALTACAGRGERAVCLFVIQRSDGQGFGAARAIDPEYAAALDKARETGVEILPCLAKVTPEGVSLTGAMAPVRDYPAVP